MQPDHQPNAVAEAFDNTVPKTLENPSISIQEFERLIASSSAFQRQQHMELSTFIGDSDRPESDKRIRNIPGLSDKLYGVIVRCMWLAFFAGRHYKDDVDFLNGLMSLQDDRDDRGGVLKK